MFSRLLSVAILLILMTSPVIAKGVENVSAVQVREMLQSKGGYFLLDVRTLQEYFKVHLAGAKLIPVDQVVKRLAGIPKDRPLIVYCAVGSRSSTAGDYLVQAGYSQVYNLYGGIWGWQMRGFPVEKGSP